MANLYRTLEDMSARLIAGVAEHGLVEGVDESLPLLVPETLKSLASSAVYTPGQGLDQLIDQIEIARDLELIEDVKLPTEEDMPKVVTAFNQLVARRKTIESLARSMEDIETGDPGRELMAYDRINDLKPSDGVEDPDSVIVLPENVGEIEHIIPDRSHFASTGTVFDCWCKLGPGEVGVILGQPNAGKSAALVDIGAGYAENNEGAIFHFSEEMGLGSCVGRYDRRVCRGATGRKKLKIWEALQGNLVIEAHPAKSSTVRFLENRVRKVCTELEQDVVAVIIDAAYLLKSSREYNSGYDSQNEVIVGLRGMAARLQTPIWTCVQPQRNAAREVRQARTSLAIEHDLPLLDMHDVAECWAIPQTVDYLTSINQTTEERNMNPPQVRIHRCKVREVDPALKKRKTPFEVQADYDTSTFI
jgi:hypothetical protein